MEVPREARRTAGTQDCRRGTAGDVHGCRFEALDSDEGSQEGDLQMRILLHLRFFEEMGGREVEGEEGAKRSVLLTFCISS